MHLDNQSLAALLPCSNVGAHQDITTVLFYISLVYTSNPIQGHNIALQKRLFLTVMQNFRLLLTVYNL